MHILSTICNRKRLEFLHHFIIADGLKSLVSLIGNKNLFARGQAMEIFFSITDCDMFDWFADRSDDFGKTLYSKFLEVYSTTPFLDNLMKNRLESYPGGSMRSLQLLAFYLSWIRVKFTTQQKVQLSDGLLFDLDNWNIATEDEDEIKLARTLYDDFREAGVAKTCSLGVHQISSYFISLVTWPANIPSGSSRQLEFGETMPSKKVGNEEIKNQKNNEKSKILTFEDAILKASEIKESGNMQFKNGKLISALQTYLTALALFDTFDIVNSTSLDADTLISSLFYNCASTIWKIYQSKDIPSADSLKGYPIVEQLLNCSSNLKTHLLEICIEYCGKCRKINPTHRKAFFREISSLLALRMPEEALKLMEEAIAVCDINIHVNTHSIGLNADSATSSEEFRFKDLHRECIAAVVVQREHLSKSGDTNEEKNETATALQTTIGSQASTVLQQLRNRRLRQLGLLPLDNNALTKDLPSSNVSTSVPSSNDTAQVDSCNDSDFEVANSTDMMSMLSLSDKNTKYDEKINSILQMSSSTTTKATKVSKAESSSKATTNTSTSKTASKRAKQLKKIANSLNLSHLTPQSERHLEISKEVMQVLLVILTLFLICVHSNNILLINFNAQVLEALWNDNLTLSEMFSTIGWSIENDMFILFVVLLSNSSIESSVRLKVFFII
jgi:hypothetical protein